ncbi:MAG: hypothetical protein K5666_03830 [Bacilli bacterium]|nr:hypothetical protein [Bacilli bacterium]
MAKCLAIVAFIIGLLKFAQDAPDLIKKVFSGGLGGGLLNGIDLNPKGQIKKNIDAAKKTVNQAKGFASNVAHAPGRAVKGALKGGAGIVGGGRAALRGIKNLGSIKEGFKDIGKAKGFENTVASIGKAIKGVGTGIGEIGAGAVAGARAGAAHGARYGLGAYVDAATDRALNYTEENRTSFNEAHSTFSSKYKDLMSKNAKDIEKQKNRKDQLKARYESDVHEYMVKNIDGINSGIASDKSSYMLEAWDYYKKMNPEASDDEITDMVNVLSDSDLGRVIAQSRAESYFKNAYDNNVKACDTEIARLQADSIAGNADLVMDLLGKYASSQSKFGDAINTEFSDKLKENLSKLKGAQAADINDTINAALKTSGQTYVGDGNVGLSASDVQNIVNSLYSNAPGGKLDAKQLDAVHQLMEAVKKSDEKTHASVSVVPINTATEAKKDGGK